jgi:hypothetical protein
MDEGNIAIWQAARATSAATSFLDPSLSERQKSIGRRVISLFSQEDTSVRLKSRII